MKKLYLLAAVTALLAGAYVFAVVNVDGHILSAPTPRPIPTISHVLDKYLDTPTPTAEPRSTAEPRTYNIVLLGGDQTAERAARGERLDGYQHTDVFVIVHIEMSDPPRATAILVPRNLWVPDAMMIDEGAGPFQVHPLWSMEVYGRTGAPGINEYVRRVFGLPIDAVFYVRMDRFPELIDKYFRGLSIEVASGKTVHMSGAEVLGYLRDNDNNWGCLEYDCEGRVFRVIDAMKTSVSGLLPWELLGLIKANWGDVATDVSIQQANTLGWNFLSFIVLKGTVKYVRLWTPEIQQADTPLDVRGMVPTVPLYKWMEQILQP